MKRFLKMLTSLLAVVMLCVACAGMVGCTEKVVKLQLKVAVYDYESGDWYDGSDTVITVDLYKEYAPKTVSNIVKYAKAGYYDNAVFYMVNGEANKIFVGDIKVDADGNLYQNEIKMPVEGEFEKGSVKGSPLTVKKGSVALWRTWGENESYKTTTSINSGRATWFLPTADISSYNEYFAVFATIDMSATKNLNTFGYIKSALENVDESLEYQVYYTGDYDAEKDMQNNGLEFNIVKADEYDESKIANLHESEGYELVEYNSKKIIIAGAGASDSVCGAKIVSAKIV